MFAAVAIVGAASAAGPREWAGLGNVARRSAALFRHGCHTAVHFGGIVYNHRCLCSAVGLTQQRWEKEIKWNESLTSCSAPRLHNHRFYWLILPRYLLLYFHVMHILLQRLFVLRASNKAEMWSWFRFLSLSLIPFLYFICCGVSSLDEIFFF